LKTVFYLEWKRYKRKVGDNLLALGVSLLILYVVAAVLGKVLPDFNRDYLKLPGYMKELLGLSGWSSCLWYNFWQFLAVIYPFVHIYITLNMLSLSLQDEERLETIVFMRNAGVGRPAVMGAKVLLWSGYSLALCTVAFLITFLLAWLSGIQVVSSLLFRYYAGLFLVTVFFEGIALNLAISKKSHQECRDLHLSWLVLPWMLAKVPDVIRMFGKLLEITGRSETIVVRLEVWGERTDFLHNFSPIAWCTPMGSELLSGVLVGYIVVGIVLYLTAFKIYMNK